mmetsp:Transcript_12945/g.25097  ORF Transcript_12945/g.25097 Transcript_12945/m.25097 type:complete len:519 (-) Transcript_12945:255-1811(-)
MASMQDLANEAAQLSAAGKFGDAIDKYDKIIDMNDTIAEVFLNRGVAMFNAGDVEGAADSFQRAADLKPELTVAYSNLGNALKQLDRNTDAAAAYRKALDKDGKNTKIWTSYVHVLNAAGNFQDALQAAADGLKAIGSSHTPLHNERIFSFLNLGHVIDALPDVEAILKATPMETLPIEQRELYGMVLAQKGSQLMSDGKFKEAEKYLKRACDGDDAPQNLFPYGVCLIQVEKEDEAISVLKQAMEQDDKNWRIPVSLGTVYLRQKDFASAVEYLERSMELDDQPRNDPMVNFNYAVALMNLGRDAEAKAPLELVVSAEPENHVALGLLGTILIHERDFDQAAEVLERAAKLDPAQKDSSIHYNLGYARLMQDKPEEALRSFQRAQEINPSSEQAKAAVESLRTVVNEKVPERTSLRKSLFRRSSSRKSQSRSGASGEPSMDELLRVAQSRSASPYLSEDEMRKKAERAKTPLERIQALLGPEKPEYLRRRSMEGIRAGYVVALAEVYDEMTLENIRK